MHFSTYLEDALLDHITNFAALTAATLWSALHSDAPAETGANELTGGSYARQSTAFGASSGGTAANTALESFDLTGVTSGEIMFVGLWDAVSGVNFMWGVPLGGTPATFTALDTGDVFTSAGHGYANDDRVIITADGGSALPAGPAEDTVYWIVGVSGVTFQISTTQGGGAVVLTSDGEGISFLVDAKTFNNGDTFEIAIGDIDLFLF